MDCNFITPIQLSTDIPPVIVTPYDSTKPFFFQTLSCPTPIFYDNIRSDISNSVYFFLIPILFLVLYLGLKIGSFIYR